jgi:hypothetical protein
MSVLIEKIRALLPARGYYLSPDARQHLIRGYSGWERRDDVEARLRPGERMHRPGAAGIFKESSLSGPSNSSAAWRCSPRAGGVRIWQVKGRHGPFRFSQATQGV